MCKRTEREDGVCTKNFEAGEVLVCVARVRIEIVGFHFFLSNAELEKGRDMEIRNS
jgi:hypothetical protein